MTPSVKTACSLRLILSDDDLKKMGLWWVMVMHEPVAVKNDLAIKTEYVRCRMRLNRIGGSWLSAVSVREDSQEEILQGQGYAFFRPA